MNANDKIYKIMTTYHVDYDEAVRFYNHLYAPIIETEELLKAAEEVIGEKQEGVE